MNTRTEVISGYTYCAYCGKELKNHYYGIYPEPPTVCNCEKAKEELDLYKKLKDLYNAPLAEILIDKKVQKYRNELLGIKEPTYYYEGQLASVTCLDGIAATNAINTIHKEPINTISGHSICYEDGELYTVDN